MTSLTRRRHAALSHVPPGKMGVDPDGVELDDEAVKDNKLSSERLRHAREAISCRAPTAMED